MSNAKHELHDRRATWGWRILALLGLLLIADGAWLFFAVGGGDVFEGDTGVSMDEVRQAYPSVVDVANRRGGLIGLLVMGIGAVSLTAGFGGRTRDAWRSAAAVGATALAVTIYVVAAGNVEIGVVWLVFAVLAGAGLALARPGLERT